MTSPVPYRRRLPGRRPGETHTLHVGIRCPCTPVGIGAVLALDPGLSLGWALRTPDGLVTHGTLDLRSRRFEGGGMRFLRFRQWLAEVKSAAETLEAIYFEEVRAHRGVDAAHVYGGLVATLTAWCEHHDIPYAGVPVGTWKRDLTGKGNADKAGVRAAVQNLGYAPETQDEADALAILHHVAGGS